MVDSEKQCKESDRSSNISDLKLELRTTDLDYGGHESETSESVVTRVGVPLAGPVPLYNTRLSTSDCNEPVFPPKSVSDPYHAQIGNPYHTSSSLTYLPTFLLYGANLESGSVNRPVLR